MIYLCKELDPNIPILLVNFSEDQIHGLPEAQVIIKNLILLVLKNIFTNKKGGVRMHSRVFQLSEDFLTKDDYISEVTLHDCFVGQIADYAIETNDRKNDLEWLKSVIGKYGAVVDVEKETVYFPEGFKEAYFKEKYEEFKKLVEELTLEEFAGTDVRGGFKRYQIESLMENKFGFYVYIDYPQTLDDFVRYLSEGATYYVGSIFDYHA